MGVNISLFAGVGAQLFDNVGVPLVGGKIYTYAAGTTTPLATYTDFTGNTAHSNPIILDAAGRVNEIWLTDGVSYKFVVKDSNDVLIGTYDNINSTFIASDLANNSNPALGDALIGFRQSNSSGNLAGAVGKTVHQKFQDYICAHDFMTEAQITDSQSGAPTLDMTAAVQAALDTTKSIYFPQGVYLVDELTIPFEARGAIYFGDGFYHYTDTKKTVIKARSASQTHVFLIGNSGSSGADCLTFTQMHIECDDKAAIGIDASYGAFFTMTDAGVYNYTDYGVYHKQGLARYDRVFMSTSNTTNATAVGLHLYSDSTVSDSEFSGGGTPIKIVAGGNRLVNIWANTGAESCITLTPFDASTTHINTSLVNIYAGEVLMESPTGVKPIIEMIGLSGQQVQEVQFTNSYLVSAAGAAYKKNGGILMDYCNAIALSNIVMRGNGADGTADFYTDYFVKIQRSKTITITGCIANLVNKNPIYLVSSIDQPVIIDGCQFYNWAVDAVATTNEFAAVRCESGTAAVVTNCVFHIDTGATGPYAAYAANAGALTFANNMISFPNGDAIKVGAGDIASIITRGGFKDILGYSFSEGSLNGTTINLTTGSFGSAGSGSAETFTLTTLPNTSTQKLYVATLSQQGAGNNTAMYYINVYGGNASAIRIAGDTVTPGTNELIIAMSGLAVQATVGSSYGVITWRWNINQLV